jgi:molybdopterin/thiamine biosynthesis adenylyltransferase/rhodanese-related sulfurtransferase
MTHETSRWFFVNESIKDPSILKRLSRHLVLSGWDHLLQSQLDDLNVLVVGAGGLGSTLCMLLSGSLFSNKTLTIMDPDSIEASNLHRQIAFREMDIGLSKAKRLAEACRERNSSCNVLYLSESLNDSNGRSLFEANDVIFDCTDNVDARILMSDLWHQTGRRKHLISGSCVGWCGQIANIVPNNPFCLRCIYGCDEDEKQGCNRLGQCALQGVMGPVVSIIASMQLMYLINQIKSPTEKSKLALLEFSTDAGSTRHVEVPPNCSSCLGIGMREEKHSQSDTQTGTIDVTSMEITGNELASLLSASACKILDVRERKPFMYSRFKDAVNVPASQYLYLSPEFRPIETLRELLCVYHQTIVVVCRRGNDSLKFTRAAREAFPGIRIVSLKGGLERLGLDIV